MKSNAKDEPAPLTSGGMETTSITISQDEGDMTMIMDVLTSTLYTDKIAAQLREYGCNGFDANVEAGNQDKPLQVRLPNKLDQSLSIRDFGFGMDKGQIAKVFCQLGRSTKRNSNEFTGMLGIGSKAGFAYGDQFMVTTFVKGQKTVYNAYRDKGRPQLAQLHEESTTEPDGLEIKIPVRMQDIPEFAKKAERVFRYFKVLPDITGATIQWADRKHEFGGQGWRYTGKNGSVAIMGNVGYTIDGAAMGLPMDQVDSYRYHRNVNTLSEDTKLAMAIAGGIELDFKIGELEIAANREGLQYKDRTKKAIRDRLNLMISEVANVFSAKLSAAKSLWEAKSIYNSIFGRDDYGQITIHKLLAKDVKWNGKVITSPNFDFCSKKVPGVGVTRFNLRNRKMVGSSSYTYYTYSYGSTNNTVMMQPAEIEARSNTIIVDNDLPSLAHSPIRLKGYFEKNPDCEDIIVLTFKDDATKKAYLKDRELDESQLLKYSSLPQFVAPPSLAAPSVHRAKHTAKVFVLDEACNGNWGTVKSLFWKTETVDLKKDGGAYVKLESFFIYPPSGSTHGTEHPSEFLKKIKMFRAAGLLTEPVYGIKHPVLHPSSNVSPLGPKWKYLDVVLLENYNKLAKSSKLPQELADSNAALSYDRVIDEKFADKFPAKSLMQKYLKSITELHNSCKLPLELRKLFNKAQTEPWLHLPTTIPAASIDLAKEEQKVYAKYPLLKDIDRWSLKNGAANMINRIVDYVSLIESSQPKAKTS